jgi:Tesmin/TSO1-like CXC domain, cysteine-rich domain
MQLYCDCFASSSYCSPSRCNCTACFNNLESENSRRIAVISTIERNPNAFRSKILSSSNPASSSQNQSAAEVALHHKGCHCKKSNCLKKYCECFQLGIVCSDRCRCNNCKNFPGSVERNKCLTVGIKEISQIIRKSESANAVSEPSLTSSSVSSSSSGSGLGLPIAPPDVALVRRLDGLGSMITHDVISKVSAYSEALQSANVLLTLSKHAAHFFLQVCQSMLQTAYQELEENSIAVGRKHRMGPIATQLKAMTPWSP